MKYFFYHIVSLFLFANLLETKPHKKCKPFKGQNRLSKNLLQNSLLVREQDLDFSRAYFAARFKKILDDASLEELSTFNDELTEEELDWIENDLAQEADRVLSLVKDAFAKLSSEDRKHLIDSFEMVVANGDNPCCICCESDASGLLQTKQCLHVLCQGCFIKMTLYLKFDTIYQTDLLKCPICRHQIKTKDL